MELESVRRRVIIRVEPDSGLTPGGLWLPPKRAFGGDEVFGKATRRGTVLAVGPGVIREDENGNRVLSPCSVLPGQHVIFKDHCGTILNNDDTLLSLHDDDLLAVEE